MTNQNGLEWENKPSHATVPLRAKQLINLNLCKNLNVYEKNLKTYSYGRPTQGQSNHTSFRQSWGGETSPLKRQCYAIYLSSIVEPALYNSDHKKLTFNLKDS